MSAKLDNSNRDGGLTGDNTRIEEAEARTEHAENRAEVAEARTDQVEMRRDQAEVRIDQAEGRTDKAEMRREQAEVRIDQAEGRTDKAEMRREQAEARIDRAEGRTDKAEMRREQAEGRIDQAETRNAETIRVSELSYRRLFEAARDGILILDVATGCITDVNPFLVELLGFSHDEMAGKTVGELSPFKDIEENKVMLGRLQKDGYVRYEDLPLETRDGRHIDVEFVSNVYRAGDKNVIQCNIRDITARKLIEVQREAAREESEILLKEVHHRVKNNMQVISSLLSLHARKLHDPAQKTVFAECQDRIRVMSLIHERLYRTGEFARIEFGGYLVEMTRMILGSSAESATRVRLDLQMDPVEIDLDAAIPLSLIASELVINALKHGFAGGRAGVLTVRLRAGVDRDELTVQDDGPGMPPDFAPEQSSGIGIELVEGLTRQIRGQREMQSGPGGTSVTIRWPAQCQPRHQQAVPR